MAAAERNLRVTLEYDGTDFAGWQRQAPPARTVQQALEDVIEKMTGTPVIVRGAGRTDAGVHARAQVASFVTAAGIPLLGFLRGMNAGLPKDVAVTAIDEVPADFDARRAARGKHYAYRIWNREVRSPLAARTTWHIYRELDVDAMRLAAAPLIGEHDFSAFRAADCERKNPIRVLRRLDVTRTAETVTVDIEATAFLKNMVRVIAGTLAEVGLGARDPGEIAGILAGRDRTRAGRTAPALGLTLEQVFYEPVSPGVLER
jgi:tRNA pseudouridine38-40 synthase